MKAFGRSHWEGAGPTAYDVDRALSPRSVGARLAQGPWQALPKGRYAVPAVAFLSLWPLGELVIVREGRHWVVESRRGGETSAAESMRWES
jgi:hypothetical protein